MFIMEEETKNKSKADIRVVGVGGGGSNAIETMIKAGIQGVQFIAINTDDQALEGSSAKIKIQLGSRLTKGLGAGANPEVGRRAAVESYEDIVKALQGADMVFITAGMGGGTGTGGTPLVAQAADELGVLTVAIVTKPFLFEGRKRMKQANQGIQDLSKYVDTLIVIPNEKLLQVSEKNTPLIETFKITDNVLFQAVKGIAELVSVPGLINLDFADIKTVMLDKGMALMGRGIAEGADRAKKAICEVVSSPLLDGMSVKGATGIIVNITASSSLSLVEVQEASAILTQLADNEADVIVGTVIDEKMEDKLSITVIATGFKDEESEKSDHSLLSFKKEIMSQIENKEKSSPILESNTIQHSFVEEPVIKKEEEQVFSEKEENSDSESLSSDEQSVPSQEEAMDKMSIEIEAQPSPKDILLSKVKEYDQKKNDKEVFSQESQMDIGWDENSLEENLSSPFESSVDFSDKDMI